MNDRAALQKARDDGKATVALLQPYSHHLPKQAASQVTDLKPDCCVELHIAQAHTLTLHAEVKAAAFKEHLRREIVHASSFIRCCGW